MKFLKKLIVSESLKYLEKDLKIGFVDFSETSQISKELEDDIINNRDLILLKRYTKEKKFDLIKNDRNWKDPKKRIWAKGERKIAINAYYSFTYAEEIIKDQIQEDPNRWVEGEKSIANNPNYSYHYAEEIIKDQIKKDPNRWVEGEKSISTDPKLSFQYIIKVIGDQIQEDPNRWVEGEKSIASVPQSAYNYAKNVIMNQTMNDPNWKDPEKRRWKEGEKSIATDPKTSYYYALEIIKDQIQEDPNRWVEGEKSISTDSELSMKYIKFVTNRLFPLAEKVFLSNYEINEYMDFIKKNWNTFSEKEKKDINPDILKLIKF